jgi:hypothetical protein
VDFDTGSADLFLPGTSCGSACGGQERYNPSGSSSAQSLGTTFQVSYGDGSGAAGNVYKDTISLAGFKVRDFLAVSVLIPKACHRPLHRRLALPRMQPVSRKKSLMG